MSRRLTPIVVAQRQINAWNDRRERLIEQLNAAQAHVDRWEMIRDEIARDEANSPEQLEVPQ